MLHHLVVGPASWARQALHCSLVFKLSKICFTINFESLGSSVKRAKDVMQQHMLSGKLDNIIKLC